MGYSSRYHAASLAAVFLALAVGILIGVGFGSDIVSGTADDLENSLASDLDERQQQVDDLEADLESERAFSEAVTPAVVADRLRGREVAVIALGDLDGALAGEIRDAAELAGATLSEVAVVAAPPDTAAAATAIREAGGPNEPRGAALERASKRLGRALIDGGPSFDALRGAMLTRYSGRPGDIDAIVLVRELPEELSPRDAADTERLERGLIEGMRSIADPRGLAVVGVEQTTTEPSSIGFFTDNGAASVDNLDQLPGQVALVYALDGAVGTFGVKDSADSLVPDLLSPPSLRFAGPSEG